MKENCLFEIGYIIKNDFCKESANCNLSEKSAVIALTIHNLLGGEIYYFTGGCYGKFYCNKIKNNFYNLALDSMTLNYDNSQPADINVLYEDNNIVYNYHKFEIELIKKYMLYLRKYNEPIEEYLELVNLIPFLEKLYKQSTLYDDNEISNYDLTIKNVNGIINDMKNKFKNVELYLFLQDKLLECEKNYMEFKKELLTNKEKRLK